MTMSDGGTELVVVVGTVVVVDVVEVVDVVDVVDVVVVDDVVELDCNVLSVGTEFDGTVVGDVVDVAIDVDELDDVDDVVETSEVDVEEATEAGVTGTVVAIDVEVVVGGFGIDASTYPREHLAVAFQ